MEENDYIELQTLLAKLRVVCLKKIGNEETASSEREKNLRLVRNIDNIRRQMPLKLGENIIVTTDYKERNGQ